MTHPVTIVTLFGKVGCHLCDDVKALIDEVGPELGVAAEWVDITSDATLDARYRYEIPVVVANGQEVGRGRLEEREWIARLRAATRG